MMNAGMPEYYRKYLMGNAFSKAAISNYTHLDQLRERYEEAIERQYQPIVEAITNRAIELEIDIRTISNSTCITIPPSQHSTRSQAG